MIFKFVHFLQFFITFLSPKNDVVHAVIGGGCKEGKRRAGEDGSRAVARRTGIAWTKFPRIQRRRATLMALPTTGKGKGKGRNGSKRQRDGAGQGSTIGGLQGSFPTIAAPARRAAFARHQ